MKRICLVYKCAKQEELYLYVDNQEKLSKVPRSLLEQLGKLTLVTTLLLTPDKKLAKADARKVLNQIADRGYYLQLPPSRKDSLIIKGG